MQDIENIYFFYSMYNSMTNTTENKICSEQFLLKKQEKDVRKSMKPLPLRSWKRKSKIKITTNDNIIL